MKKNRLPLLVIGILVIASLAVAALDVAVIGVTVTAVRKNDASKPLVAASKNSSRQISPAEADTICGRFFDQFIADIQTLPGYSLAGSTKNCAPEGDSTGTVDYNLTAAIRITSDSLGTPGGIRQGLNSVANALPGRGYPVWTDNVPGDDSVPAAICVTADKYIDNDGSDYLQGQAGHYPRYTEPGSAPGFAPCAGI